jgi:hypothetical protein
VENPRKLVAYIRGYREGLAWLFDPANKQEAIALLRKNLPQLSESLAEQSYGILVSPKGFAADGALSIEGVRRVREYGQPKRALTDPLLYYDPQYYEAAKR